MSSRNFNMSHYCLIVQGHGYVLDPPQRNSAWRRGFNVKVDSNDVANFCGGASVRFQLLCGSNLGVNRMRKAYQPTCTRPSTD